MLFFLPRKPGKDWSLLLIRDEITEDSSESPATAAGRKRKKGLDFRRRRRRRGSGNETKALDSSVRFHAAYLFQKKAMGFMQNVAL